METCPVCAHAMELEEAAPTILVCASCATPFVPERTTGTRLPAELSARYRLGHRVGAGAMGTVYQARALADDAPVAIKLLTRTDHPDALARFLREARLLMAVRHPNVVAVREVAEVDGHPFLVTEFLAGGTLRDRLDRGGALGTAAAVELARQALAGLAACHDAGIVHRDVKPANLLLDGAGALKVADFGVARGPNEQRLTRTGARLGSPNYMAPEQARGDVAGPAADVYSAGVVLHEMLAGELPIDAPSVPAMLAALQVKAPAPLPPHVPAGVSAAVAQALAKDPAKRPSARAFADLLVRPAPARAQGPWATLSVITFLGLMLLAAISPRGKTAAPPPAATPSVAAPPPSVPAAPAHTERDEVRALLAEIDLAPVPLTPWTAGEEVDCPLVLVCADHVDRLRIEAAGCRVIEVNGVPLEDAGLVAARAARISVLTPVAHRLHDGVNWVRLKIEPGARPRATVFPDRKPCAPPLSSAVPPEVAGYNRVNAALFARVPADTVAGRAAVSQEYPAGDPRAQAALVRISTVEDDFVDNIAGVWEQVTDDPVWTDPVKLALCHKGVDTLQASLSANPQSWDLWNDLGYIMRKCGQQTAARAALVKALTLWPGAFWSWRELGFLSRRQYRERSGDFARRRKEAARELRLAQRFYLASGLSIFWMVPELDAALNGL